MPKAIYFAICAHLDSIPPGREVSNPLFSFVLAHYAGMVAELKIPITSRLETALFVNFILSKEEVS